ncbi:MAG: trehalose-phosphatase, partial [Psychrobacter sp.]|nr:trehalose-phosphatase [Psychrobacter sp.]
MSLAKIVDSPVRSPTYIQPDSFGTYLSAQQRYGLFLDIDGTLAEFTLNPSDSFIPHATLMLLEQIQSEGVPIAVVTGRSLTEARQMLSPLQLPIAATHGLEIAVNGDTTSTTQVNNSELTAIKQAVVNSCQPYGELMIEDKPYSVALHFRQCPSLAKTTFTIMLNALNAYPNWALKQGEYVWEIVPKGVNKGSAILTILNALPTADKVCPIFIGDDVTDEAGFSVVQGNELIADNLTNKDLKKDATFIEGMGIKVGLKPTCARFYVRDIQEVTILLKSFLDFC